jgi:hypothetical protein
MQNGCVITKPGSIDSRPVCLVGRLTHQKCEATQPHVAVNDASPTMIGSMAAYLVVVLAVEFRVVLYMHESGKTITPHRAHLMELTWKAETASGAVTACLPIVRR